MQTAFDYGIVDQLQHRPWPMPVGPWIMTQTWHDLLFAHWPIAAARLAPLIPPPLELDLFEGHAWLGIVPFHMTNVAPRGVPALPWLSAFPELNVRTYVRMGDKAGVYFFSLDAGNRLAVGVARALFRLPYHLADMRVTAADDDRRRTIHYGSRRSAPAAVRAELAASYYPSGSVFRAAKGTIDYFLTERYCLYVVTGRTRALRLEIHHPPWALQAAEARFDVNTMADGLGIGLPAVAPLLHFARRQDVVAWPLVRTSPRSDSA